MSIAKLAEITNKIDASKFPCPPAYKPMLTELLNCVEDKKLNDAEETWNMVIAILASKIKEVNNGNVNRSYAKILRNELKFSCSENKILIKQKALGKYSTQDLEEIISIICQTKSIRETGYVNGTLIRKQAGIFYTPYPIAARIAMEATSFLSRTFLKELYKTKDEIYQRELYERFLDLKIIDPACGTGIILSAIVDRLTYINDQLKDVLSKKPFYRPKELFVKELTENGIFGIDLDIRTCCATRILLSSKYNANMSKLSNNIRCANTLLTDNLLFRKGFSFDREFPSVFSKKKGFDIVIMNPPYERLKVDKSEFKGMNNSGRLCQSNKDTISQLVYRVRKSKQFPLANEGVLDLYKLFIDKATQITHKAGIVSFIVPLTLLGDRSCKKIREFIFNHTEIGNIYCIPETARAFHNVSQAFCIMGFKKGEKKQQFRIFKDTTSILPLKYAQKINILTADIFSICPKSLSIPICDQQGWPILNKIHKYPNLALIDEVLNLRGEVDLTLGAKYITSNANEEKLIRGNDIDSYRLKLEQNRKDSYVMLDNMYKDKFGGLKLQYINTERLAGQQIVNMSVKRRLKFSLIKKGILANSCNFITTKNKQFLLYLLGLFNSALLNWRFKLTSTNNHVNNYELDELPIANHGEKYLFLQEKIATYAKSQYNNYSENRQIQLDAMVSLIYGLSLQEGLYISEQFAITPQQKDIYIKAFRDAKNDI